MTQLSTRQGGSSDSIACLLDVVDKKTGLSAGVAPSAIGRNAVEVLRTNGDTNDQVSESSTVLVNGRLQRSDLVVERLLSSGCPQSKEEGGLGVDSGLNRFNDSVLGSVLDHGVETSAGPTVGTGQGLCRIELILEVGQSFCSIIVELSTVVEALDGSIGSGQKGRRGDNGRCEAHYE